MTDPVAHANDYIPLSLERRIDEICMRFENALQGGQTVTIEEHLLKIAESERVAILRELVRLEVEYRVRRGEQPGMNEYLSRFPAHADSIASWFESMPTIGWDSRVLRPKSWPTVPGYELVEELGHGGMGIVYKARHEKFERLVALKMIIAGAHASAEYKDRFLAEARAVARLQNPHIVQIHEIGEIDGSPYFSLEYVDGGNLGRLRDSPDDQAARLLELLARTVHYAHGRGIVHRDLKPANILLTSDGVP
ncbi:MAG TPA: serine/threonine-protein kinase, partial [Gemmataceae bacterium]|nr:serine/threonine-protein kinase [Gemmataceae bacterium]